jgi:hypothetical protein
MLESTASADAEEWAESFNPERRGLYCFQDGCPEEVCVFFCYFTEQSFSRDTERDKDDLSIGERDTIPARSELFDVQDSPIGHSEKDSTPSLINFASALKGLVI